MGSCCCADPPAPMLSGYKPQCTNIAKVSYCWTNINISQNPSTPKPKSYDGMIVSTLDEELIKFLETFSKNFGLYSKKLGGVYPTFFLKLGYEERDKSMNTTLMTNIMYDAGYKLLSSAAYTVDLALNEFAETLFFEKNITGNNDDDDAKENEYMPVPDTEMMGFYSGYNFQGLREALKKSLNN
mmetsp:Transcript_24322/g.29706  ORF Transcript_24322/g.29706 Transcript_24322/m.29706 type:complete len:184 (+) Transcript_24322:106-657(+)